MHPASEQFLHDDSAKRSSDTSHAAEADWPAPRRELHSKIYSSPSVCLARRLALLDVVLKHLSAISLVEAVMLLRLKPLLKKPVALALCCRRTNMAAVGGAGEVSADKYTCCEDGKSDCPCFTSEKSRPPPAPVALAPMKVRDSLAGAVDWFRS